MYRHVKKLMYAVRVDAPDPAFGNMLLEQFGGANGELAAAMQYSIQGFNCDDLERKDLLMQAVNVVARIATIGGVDFEWVQGVLDHRDRYVGRKGTVPGAPIRSRVERNLPLSRS
jgi:hypothetical protein